MSDNSLISQLYRVALRPIRDEPLPVMPRSLYAYVRRVSGRQQLWLSLLTVLVFPLTLAPLELQRRMVDGAVAGSDLGALFLLGGLYMAVVVVHGGLKYLRNVNIDRVRESVAQLLRRRIVRNDAFEFDTEDGTRQSIIAAEAEKVGGFVAESVAFPLLQAGIVASVTAYMLVIEPLMAAVSLAFFAPSLVIVAVFQPKLDRLTGRKIEAVRHLAESVLRHDAESGSGANGTADTCIERVYQVALQFAFVKHGMKLLNNFFGHLGPLAVLVAGGWMVIRGETEVGTIVAFVSAFERITDPARELLAFYRRLSLMRVQYGLVQSAAEGKEAPA